MLVKIYTDGSARGNPDGPGGYGCVLHYTDAKGTLHEREFSQGYVRTTCLLYTSKQKRYEREDLYDADLALAATDDRAVNEDIYSACKCLGILDVYKRQGILRQDGTAG